MHIPQALSLDQNNVTLCLTEANVLFCCFSQNVGFLSTLTCTSHVSWTFKYAHLVLSSRDGCVGLCWFGLVWVRKDCGLACFFAPGRVRQKCAHFCRPIIGGPGFSPTDRRHQEQHSDHMENGDMIFTIVSRPCSHSPPNQQGHRTCSTAKELAVSTGSQENVFFWRLLVQAHFVSLLGLLAVATLLPCPSTCRSAWRTHHRHWRPHFYAALLHTAKSVVSCSHPPGDHQSLIDIRQDSPQARTCSKISPLFGAPPRPSAPLLIVGSARGRNPAKEIGAEFLL